MDGDGNAIYITVQCITLDEVKSFRMIVIYKLTLLHGSESRTLTSAIGKPNIGNINEHIHDTFATPVHSTFDKL